MKEEKILDIFSNGQENGQKNGRKNGHTFYQTRFSRSDAYLILHFYFFLNFFIFLSSMKISVVFKAKVFMNNCLFEKYFFHLHLWKLFLKSIFFLLHLWKSLARMRQILKASVLLQMRKKIFLWNFWVLASLCFFVLNFNFNCFKKWFPVCLSVSYLFVSTFG